MNNHPLRLLGNSTRMVHIPIRQRVIAAVWGAAFGTGTLEKLPAASTAGGSSREKSSANPVVSAPWANREIASGPKRTGYGHMTFGLFPNSILKEAAQFFQTWDCKVQTLLSAVDLKCC